MKKLNKKKKKIELLEDEIKQSIKNEPGQPVKLVTQIMKSC